jgi:hypothetical protein
MEESKRIRTMGAVKEAAIQLEIRQADAVELGDPGTAYRLGMYEACRLIHQWQTYYLKTGAEADLQEALGNAWRDIYDSAKYLYDVTYR